jgi:hypothetical protein
MMKKGKESCKLKDKTKKEKDNNMKRCKLKKNSRTKGKPKAKMN